MMRQINGNQLKQLIKGRPANKRLTVSECYLSDCDLSGWDLSNIDFSLTAFQGVILNHVNFSNSSLENARLDGCPLRQVTFINANLRCTSLRRCDLTGSNLSGVDLYGAVLEQANLAGIKTDEHTKWFRLHCPATGPFVAFKKCFNDRIVQLLVPADAKRTSATRPSCRCNKAKVLKITNFAQTEEYDEAWSLVDEHFVYRRGQWVTVDNFNNERWYDSTTGIHFWMTREEAMAY